MSGPRAVPITLSVAERQHLEKTTRQLTAPQRMVLRSRIVLLAAGGLGNSAIGRQLGCNRATAILWRGRFAQQGLAGLQDEPRPGRPRSFSPEAAP
jgi:transposase